MNKNKIYMYIGLFILLVSTVGSIGTYAWFTWSSTNNTSVTLSIGELADVTFNTGPDIKVNNLSPVYNYTDGVYTTFNITNRDTTSNLLYTVKLNITSIDTELQDKTFKYVLLENDKIVSQDNFENTQSDTILTLYTGELDKATLSKSATSTYKLYFYIDGNEENNPNMMNKSLIGKIDVSIEEATLAKYITNLYTNADKVKVGSYDDTKYNYATSVNLMDDRLGLTIFSQEGGNIRYYGASPNNYIYFNCETYPDTNCELWRIIGVFDGKVKIMRNESIGIYSWDSSASDINDGSGVNEWSQADAMKLLNPGYDTEEVGGSLYYNSGSGTCYFIDGNKTTSCDFTDVGIKNNATKNKIAEVTWNLGGFDNSSEIDFEYAGVETLYKAEIGTTVYIPGSLSNCPSCTDTVTRNATWTGLIALPYASDYGYAIDLSECNRSLYHYDEDVCTSNNWMYSILGIYKLSNAGGWLLTPESDNPASGINVEKSGSVHYNGAVSNPVGIVPTLFLNSTETIYGNNNDSSMGTESNPYKLNP